MHSIHQSATIRGPETFPSSLDNKAPSNAGQVESLLSQLSHACDYAEKAFLNHIDRLSSVLHPEANGGPVSDQEKARPVQSPLCDNLMTIIGRMDELARSIERLTNRVEL